MTTLVMRQSPARTSVLWGLQILGAAMFLFAGVHKLSADPMMVQVFGAIGLGQWFRYLTGGIEVVAGALLLIPAVAEYAAAALAVTMVGAILTHLFIIGGSPAIPIVLLAAMATIVWMRRSDR